MASLFKTGNSWVVQFTNPDASRASIRLGKLPKRTAEQIKTRIEYLQAAKLAGHALDGETALWLAELPDKLYSRLARAGLVEPRQGVEKSFPQTLAAFLDRYIASRHDIKPRTRDIFQRTRHSLVKYFGAAKPLREITKADARLWRLWLLREGATDGSPLGTNSVNDRVKKARQFFNFAVEMELIDRNPFQGLPGPVKGNAERQYFVSRREAEQVLAACPDTEWRCLFALARFGGLRVPSEVLALRWADIDWERDRFTVRSPKTERHEGKGTRTVPLFPELRLVLAEAFDLAPEGAEFVIGRYRDSNANLRTQLTRIIRRAGLKPWPKLFHNLRSTREPELAETFPVHVVCEWIGNSQVVAQKHYLQVTDEHFERAATAETPAAEALQYAHASSGNASQPASGREQKPLFFPGFSSACESMRNQEYTPEDSNLQPSVP